MKGKTGAGILAGAVLTVVGFAIPLGPSLDSFVGDHLGGFEVVADVTQGSRTFLTVETADTGEAKLRPMFDKVRTEHAKPGDYTVTFYCSVGPPGQHNKALGNGTYSVTTAGPGPAAFDAVNANCP